MLKQILTLEVQKQQRNHTAVSRLEDLTKAGCFWFCKHGCSQCTSNPHRTWWDVISIHCTDGGHISRGIQPWSFQPRQVGGWGSLGKGQKKGGKVVLVPTCQHYFFNAVSCAFHSLTSMSFWRIVPILQQASISVCMWDPKNADNARTFARSTKLSVIGAKSSLENAGTLASLEVGAEVRSSREQWRCKVKMHEAFEKGFCSHVLYFSFLPVIAVYFGSVWQFIGSRSANTPKSRGNNSINDSHVASISYFYSAPFEVKAVWWKCQAQHPRHRLTLHILDL